MYVSSLRIKNVRSFEDSNDISLSKSINIFLGANNAGKSIIIKSLFQLQDRNQLKPSDIRIGTADGEIVIDFSDLDNQEAYLMPHTRDTFTPQGMHPAKVFIRRAASEGAGNGGQWNMLMPQQSSGSWTQFNAIPWEEPKNYIYPYLSKRKVPEFTRTIDRGIALQVPSNLSNLVAKIDALADREHPAHDFYREMCKKILKFQVSAFASEGGKQAGIRANEFESIPLESMGEGVSSLLGLITQLCVAKHKLFLIEEIENDIHPEALKGLLELIAEKSTDNQFVISTHSNIVTKFLGSQDGSKLHKIEMSFNGRIPKSIYSEVENSPEARRKVLEELGYEMFDYDLWEGWLFLEESTAEKIIREYFIKWFANKLVNKLKTVSCAGADTVYPRFQDFDRLFLFTHLQPIYHNKAWVMIDGDSKGREITEQLRTDYPSWDSSRFISLSKESFEAFYPDQFAVDVGKVLKMPHGEQKQKAKLDLMNKVIDWIKQDEAVAKKEFAKSASDVVKILQSIEKELS